MTSMYTWTLSAAMLATLVWQCGATCDQYQMATCAEPFQKYQGQASGVIQPVDVEQFKLICNTFRDVNRCVKSAISTCPREVKVAWSGVDDTFSYLCSDEGMEMVQKYNPCYEKPAVQAAGVTCNRTFQAETTRLRSTTYYSQDELNGDICRISNNYVGCVSDAIEGQCDEETALWQDDVIRRALSPTMTLIDCTLAGATVRVSLLLLLTSLLSYFLLKQ